MSPTQNNFLSAEEPVPFSSPGYTVLVTGGTGFLGAYIIQNLVQKGITVRAIRRSAKLPFFIPQEVLEKVDWIEGDVLDVVSLEEAMQNVNAVIHAAALVSFHKQNRQELYQVNVEGTCNTVNAAIEKGVERFIHVSSIAALGRTDKPDIITEERKWEEHKNNTHYAISKRRAEIEVWRGFAEGLSGVVINPSTILGFGNWHHSSCAIFKNMYREFPWYTNGINGFVGVEDVAEAVVQLLQSTINHKRFIVNTDSVSFREIFNSIANGFGKKKPYKEATPFLGELAWRSEALKALITGKKPLLTKETARMAHCVTRLDNTALLKALPQFSYTPLPTVIEEACKKYRKALETGQLAL